MAEINGLSLISTVVQEFDHGLQKDGRQSEDEKLPLELVDFVAQYETDKYQCYETMVCLKRKSMDSIEEELKLESEQCADKCQHLFMYLSGGIVPRPPRPHPIPDLETIAQPGDNTCISLAKTRPDFSIICVNNLPSGEYPFTSNAFKTKPQTTGQYVKDSVVGKTSYSNTTVETVGLKHPKLPGGNKDTTARNNHTSKGRGSRYDTSEESCSGTHGAQRARRKQKSLQNQLEKGTHVSPKMRQDLREKILQRGPETEYAEETYNTLSNLPNFDLINAPP